jgi:hypothetical protein
MTTSLVRPFAVISGAQVVALRIPRASAVLIAGDFFHELRRYA